MKKIDWNFIKSLFTLIIISILLIVWIMIELEVKLEDLKDLNSLFSAILKLLLIFSPFFILLFALLFMHFKDKYSEINIIKIINNSLWLDNFLHKTWFSKINYPIIFLAKDNNDYYLSWLYYNNYQDYKKDILLSEEDGIKYCIDSKFHKYKISFLKLNELIYCENDIEIWEKEIPILSWEFETTNYEELEKILINDLKLSDWEIKKIKEQKFPKTIQTIIKFLENYY